MFSKFENLQNSDFVILNTFFNHDENQDIDLDKILNKVTNKLIDIADQAIDDSKSDHNDSNP